MFCDPVYRQLSKVGISWKTVWIGGGNIYSLHNQLYIRTIYLMSYLQLQNYPFAANYWWWTWSNYDFSISCHMTFSTRQWLWLWIKVTVMINYVGQESKKCEGSKARGIEVIPTIIYCYYDLASNGN